MPKPERVRVLEPREPKGDEDRRRLYQARRMFVVAETLLNEPHGLTAERLHHRVCERMEHDGNLRTTIRDLRLLQELGIVDQVCVPIDGLLWRLTGTHEGFCNVLLVGLANRLRQKKDTHVPPVTLGLLEGLLKRLPPPWHPSIDRQRLMAASAAASVLAALDTRDKTVREGYLIYCIGKGWQYHVYEEFSASAITMEKPVGEWASDRVRDAAAKLEPETPDEFFDGWAEGMGPDWDTWESTARYEPGSDPWEFSDENIVLHEDAESSAHLADERAAELLWGAMS